MGLMLSSKILSDTPRSFFAMLSRPTGEIYLDALDAIEEAQRKRHEGGLSRSELNDICERVLNAHKATRTVGAVVEAGGPMGEAVGEVDGDDGEVDGLFRLTPAMMVREMLAIEWLEEPRRSDYQRQFFIDSRAELLLEALRRIAYPEQVAFTDKLHLVCTRLIEDQAFIHHPLADLESCLDNARYGLQELRALQQGVARLTQRQLKSDSLRENLSVLYDDFAENIGQRCYRQLVALKLPIRLPMAKLALEQIQADTELRGRMMVELESRFPGRSEEENAEYLRRQIQELFELLDAVEPQAEAVDRRAADFARRSFARFRYLQEVSSGRREEMREFFEAINENHEGARLSDLDGMLRIPDLRLPEVGVLSGLESLAFPREKRESYQPEALVELVEEDWQTDALDEISDNITSSLNAFRANRFFESLVLSAGEAAISSAELRPDRERPHEWMVDLVALLLHAEMNEVVYRLYSSREDGVEPEADELAEYMVERFQISKK